MANNEEIPAWAEKFIAQQKVKMADLEERIAGLVITQACIQSANENPVLGDDEVSPQMQAVLDERAGKTQ